jgi:hypothetical protein
MRIVLPALAALALAGCQSEPAGNTANTATAHEPGASDDVAANEVANEQETGNALATVLGMSDRERNAVFIRAILDAGLTCETVTSSERIADKNGQPVWRANCGPRESHIISITPDGTANIVSRND